MSKAVRSPEGIVRRRQRDLQKKKEIAIRRRKEGIAYLGGKCVDCECSDPDKLEFDHRDRFTKSFAISKSPSESKFWAEIAKCVLRCKYHHRQKSNVEMSGQNHPKSKLKESHVLEILRRLRDGEVGLHLAREFSVGAMLISRIKNGKRWRHVPRG